jgi:aryl-alcohol dehydrogenase-like predicted oxidoreductase
MEYINIAPGLGRSSRLGFGCGSIMGRVGRAESLRAIDAAIDAGITHFDVARLYGYGEAEALLGEAIRGKRDRLVIASKFGLEPTHAAGALRGLKPLAQKVVGSVPGLRGVLRSVIGTKMHAAGRFSVASAQATLDRSLRALQTDYLDILFLHDCEPDEVTDELIAYLDGQIAAGRIRAYGAATGFAQIVRLNQIFGDKLLCQFGNGLCSQRADKLPPGRRRFIGHSPFFAADRLAALINAQPEKFRLKDGRKIEPSDTHGLMLGYALSVANVAVVLCSMLKDEHRRANLAAVEGQAFNSEEIAEFAAIVAVALPTAIPGPPRR